MPDDCDITTGAELTLFSDDFEEGLGNWTTSGLWRLAPNGDCLVVADGEVLTTPTQAAYNTGPESCNYDVGTTSGALELAGDIVIPANATAVTLKWYNFAETEGTGGGEGGSLGASLPRQPRRALTSGMWWFGGRRAVVDAGACRHQPLEGFWSELTADLTPTSARAPHPLRVRLARLLSNAFLGWYVDDVRVMASIPSSDCNLNGIPDECEADCNGNGVADECDITSGTSQDCNENGVPDECDITSGTE